MPTQPTSVHRAKQLPSGLWGPEEGDDVILASETFRAITFLRTFKRPTVGTAAFVQMQRGMAAAIELSRRIAQVDPELSRRLWTTASLVRDLPPDWPPGL